MQEQDNAELTVEKGITGDFRGATPDRQITILSESAWLRTCKSIDTTLPWTTRRANLLIGGIDFSAADVGKTICIGDAKLEIKRETNPCSLMDQQHQGLKEALMPEWRGGVCCNVIAAGTIRIGDQVEIN